MQQSSVLVVGGEVSLLYGTEQCTGSRWRGLYFVQQSSVLVVGGEVSLLCATEQCTGSRWRGLFTL